MLRPACSAGRSVLSRAATASTWARAISRLGVRSQAADRAEELRVAAIVEGRRAFVEREEDIGVRAHRVVGLDDAGDGDGAASSWTVRPTMPGAASKSRRQTRSLMTAMPGPLASPAAERPSREHRPREHVEVIRRHLRDEHRLRDVELQRLARDETVGRDAAERRDAGAPFEQLGAGDRRARPPGADARQDLRPARAGS